MPAAGSDQDERTARESSQQSCTWMEYGEGERESDRERQSERSAHAQAVEGVVLVARSSVY